MAQNSEISWTHHTANLWWGCQKVHAGCDHCYAETLANRWNNKVWGPHAPRRIINSFWKDVAKFQRIAAEKGEIHRVFVGSMMDIFEVPKPLVDINGNPVPGTTQDLRDRFFNEVVPACPNLTFLLLTKRPGNIMKMIPEEWKATPPWNVIYGTSVVNQETADEMIPKLQQVPGRRFLSMEPLLGNVFFKKTIEQNGGPDIFIDHLKGIDWVIVGGESGHGARPMHPDWARSIMEQCYAHRDDETAFHFKQWGEYRAYKCGEVPDLWIRKDGYIQQHADGESGTFTGMIKVGKKQAGNLLDGELYHGFPMPHAIVFHEWKGKTKK